MTRVTTYYRERGGTVPEDLARAAANAPIAHPRGDDVSARKAREAAEALFKTRPSEMPHSSGPVADTAPSGEAPPRRPRIIAIPPAVPAAPQTDAATPVATRTGSAKARHVMARDYPRIRTLATHGMTLGEVAELYDVPVSLIEKIVARS